MRWLLGFASRVFSGLRLRLLLLVLLTCTPLVILMLNNAWEDRRRARASWQQRCQTLLQTAEREQKELVGGTRQLLLAVSESAPVRSLNPSRCKKWIDELFASYPRYANLGVVSTNGDLIASAAPAEGVANLADRSFFKRVKESRAFAIGDFPVAPTKGKPTLAFGYPMLDRNGEVDAVVFAELDLTWYCRFGSEVPGQLPRAATWTMFSRAGRIIAHYPKPETWIGRPLPNPELVYSAFGNPGGVLEIPDERDIPTIFAYGTTLTELARGEVAGALSIPRQFLFSASDRELARNLTWFGIALAFALVLGWAGSRLLILRPVGALVRSSARLAAGDLTARTGLPHSHDELGQLTLAFDKMAHALEQREAERERATQKLQLLSHRLVEIQESERRHIARELHDEIGQSLTAAEMNLQAALNTPGAAALEKRLADSIQAVDHVLEQVHNLSLNLRPSMLDDLGLESALRWYTHRHQELTGMSAEFVPESVDGRLEPIVETECFRIAQEALTNITRHARAQHVSVKLTQRDGHLHLTVRDDGAGFDVNRLRSEAIRGASLGLLSMEERATLAGGGFEILSAPGKGTEVHAWFPLNHRHEHAEQ